MDKSRWRVFIPLGHTIVHFPHNMQFFIIFMASASLPLCRQSSTFLRLIPENGAAVHVALHDPQAMHLRASGSLAHSSLKRDLSRVSRFIAELGDILNPKMFIVCLLYMNESRVPPILLQQESREQSWDRYMLLHRRFRVSVIP